MIIVPQPEICLGYIMRYRYCKYNFFVISFPIYLGTLTGYVPYYVICYINSALAGYGYIRIADFALRANDENICIYIKAI